MKKTIYSLFVVFALTAALQAGITETKSFKGENGLVEFELSSDKSDWKIKVGEPVTFTAKVFTRENAKAPRTALTGRKIVCRMYGDGMKTVNKSEVLGDKPVSVTGKLDLGDGDRVNDHPVLRALDLAHLTRLGGDAHILTASISLKMFEK